jgi:hypothetical protein
MSVRSAFGGGGGGDGKNGGGRRWLFPITDTCRRRRHCCSSSSFIQTQFPRLMSFLGFLLGGGSGFIEIYLALSLLDL